MCDFVASMQASSRLPLISTYLFYIICSYFVSSRLFYIICSYFISSYLFYIICSYFISSHLFYIICSYFISTYLFYIICSYFISSYLFYIICSYFIFSYLSYIICSYFISSYFFYIICSYVFWQSICNKIFRHHMSNALHGLLEHSPPKRQREMADALALCQGWRLSTEDSKHALHQIRKQLLHDQILGWRTMASLSAADWWLWQQILIAHLGCS